MTERDIIIKIMAKESYGLSGSGDVLPLKKWKSTFHKGQDESFWTGFGINASAHPAVRDKINNHTLTLNEAIAYILPDVRRKIPGLDLMPASWRFYLMDCSFMGKTIIRQTARQIARAINLITSKHPKGSYGLPETEGWTMKHTQAVIYLAQHPAENHEILDWMRRSSNKLAKQMPKYQTGHSERWAWRINEALKLA